MQGTVLLITGNAKISDEISKLLAPSAYAVKICSDPKQAVEVTKEVKPHLILCDTNLPVISGMELARLFKRHALLAKIPFLLLTSHMPSLNELEQTGVRIEADDLIRMPITQTQLEQTIHRWLPGMENVTGRVDAAAGTGEVASKRKTPKPWNKGYVSALTLGRLFFHLITSKESGALRIRGDRRQMTAFIHNGNLVDISSNYIRDDTLGRFLVLRKRITPKENQDSLRLAMRKKMPQGQVLVQMNILDERELELYINQQKSAKFINLFCKDWNGSAFEFLAERINTRDLTGEPFPLTSALKTGLLEQTDYEELIDLFVRSRKDQLPLLLIGDLTALARQLGLDPTMVEQAKSIHGKTIKDLQSIFGEQFEFYLRLAFLLITMRGMRVEKKEGKFDQTADEGETPENVVAEEKAMPAHQVAEYHQALMEGRTLFNRGDYAGARHFLLKALESNPYSSISMAMLAWTNFELQGKNNISVAFDTKEMLKKAITIDDSNDLAYLLLGRVLKHEGKDSLAATYFKKAFELNPTNDEARHEVKLLEIKKRKIREQVFHK